MSREPKFLLLSISITAFFLFFMFVKKFPLHSLPFVMPVTCLCDKEKKRVKSKNGHDAAAVVES